jgi:hypothetical protein
MEGGVRDHPQHGGAVPLEEAVQPLGLVDALEGAADAGTVEVAEVRLERGYKGLRKPSLGDFYMMVITFGLVFRRFRLSLMEPPAVPREKVAEGALERKRGIDTVTNAAGFDIQGA